MIALITVLLFMGISSINISAIKTLAFLAERLLSDDTEMSSEMAKLDALSNPNFKEILHSLLNE